MMKSWYGVSVGAGRRVGGRDVAGQRPLADDVGERRVGVGGQEDQVVDVAALERVQQLDALVRVALPAVVRQAVELLDRVLVHDHLPPRVRVLDRVAGSGGAAASPRKVRWGLLILFLHGLRDRLGERGDQDARTGCGWSAARSGRGPAGRCRGCRRRPFAEALALRKERSSRKNSSRFLPQRKVR